MTTRFHPTTKRVAVVIVVAFAIILASTQTLLAAHNSRAASPSPAITLRGGSSHAVVRSGEVSLAKLPTFKGSASASQTARPLAVNRTPKTAAQEATYEQWVKTHASALQHATGKALSTRSPNVVGGADIPQLVNQGEGLDYAQSGGYYPPDQAVGVQLGNLVEGVNGMIEVYNYNTYAKEYGPWSAQTFFSPLYHTGDFFGDPQITYDAERGRWVVSWLEITSDGSADYLDIAISKTAAFNSTSNFYEYQIPANVTGANDFCDYDTLGYDYWGLWVSCVTFHGNSLVGNRVFGFNLNGMQAGTLGTYFWYENVPSSVSCGTNCFDPAYRLSPTIEDGVPQAEWIVATDAGWLNTGTSQNLTLCAITNTHALTAGQAPTVSCDYNTLPLSYSDPQQANQPGGLMSVNAIGYGTKQITYKNGQIYFSLASTVNCSGTTDDGILWAQVTPQLTTVAANNPQQVNGIVSGYTNAGIWCFTTADAYMPSYFPSNEGDAALVFNYSSSTVYPSIAYTGRMAADAPGSQGQGSDYATVVTGSSANTTDRWGDYSACALVPNLTTRGIIYCGGEYGGNDLWNTRLYQLRME